MCESLQLHVEIRGDEMKKWFSNENLLFISWALVAVSLAGSLFFSYVLKYVPCNLCLIQRGIMIGLVIILGFGVITKKMKVASFSLFLSFLGMIVAGYQYYLQKFAANSNDFFCTEVDCTKEYINWLGFITIPFLSFVAFFVICMISLIILKKRG